MSRNMRMQPDGSVMYISLLFLNLNIYLFFFIFSTYVFQFSQQFFEVIQAEFPTGSQLIATTYLSLNTYKIGLITFELVM